MKNTELMQVLYEKLSDYLKDFHFPCNEGTDRKTIVFYHGVPDEQDLDLFPFVVIRLYDSELNEDKDRAWVKESIVFGLGVYSRLGEIEGGKILSELYDTVLTFLHTNRIIGNKFQRLYPITASVPDPERKWSDYHMMTILTQWDYLVPVTPLYQNANDIVEL